MTNSNFPSVSVGFPVYNEKETVEEVLSQAHKLLSISGLDYEILVCDDGSTDGSQHIIENLAKRFPNFRVINHPRNVGIRATFEELYKESKKDFVFVNATDKQWDTSILLDMLPLTEKADIIIASRENKPYTLTRKFISWGFNLIPQVLFGIRTYDAGAVKLVKREIINRFSIISKSPFSEAERIIRASRSGYRIVNYPVSVSPRKIGHSHAIKPGTLFTALWDVLRVWYSIHFCKRGNKC